MDEVFLLESKVEVFTFLMRLFLEALLIRLVSSESSRLGVACCLGDFRFRGKPSRLRVVSWSLPDCSVVKVVKTCSGCRLLRP